MNTLIIFLASYLYLIIVLIGIFSCAFFEKKAQLFKLILVSFPTAYFLSKVLGAVVQSPRPFVVDHVIPLIHSATDNGFPSDHVLLSATISFLVFSYNKKLGLFLCVLTLLVGFGRVLALAHHPIDVLGSLLISAFAVSVGYFSMQFFQNQKKQNTHHQKLT